MIQCIDRSYSIIKYLYCDELMMMMSDMISSIHPSICVTC